MPQPLRTPLSPPHLRGHTPAAPCWPGASARRGFLCQSLGAAALFSGGLAWTAHAQPASGPSAAPAAGPGTLVIAHRGASGYRPEHTLAAYALAIEQGAHFIEPDLVMTRDGELVARHEPMLARVLLNDDGSIRRVDGAPVIHRSDTSTNVWQLTQYADRLKVKSLDGRPVGGWWVEDFSGAELRADVRAQERLRDLRRANSAFDNQEPIPTLQEVITLAQAASERLGRRIGIYPETKHATYFLQVAQAAGLPRMEDRLIELLHARYGNRADAPVYIQSFEVANLQYLKRKTNLRLVQLLSAGGQPYDFTAAGDRRSYADLARADAQGLDFLRAHADGIGVHTQLMIPVAGGRLGRPTSLVADAHARGLKVHGWTFRADNSFLPEEFRRGNDPAALGDMAGHLRAFLALGMDGFFADHPDLALAALGSAGRK